MIVVLALIQVIATVASVTVVAFGVPAVVWLAWDCLAGPSARAAAASRRGGGPR